MLRLPALRGTIDRRILVNYQADPDRIAAILPAPFRPKLVNDKAIVGICLIRLAAIRPRGLPAWITIGSENAAHRIAVEWQDDAGVQHEGVYVPRRDTSSCVVSLMDGRVFPGVLHRARFDVRETDDGDAWLDGRRLPTEPGERRGPDGKLELLGIESADPRWVRDAADALAERAYRLRALGTIASTLCQVAAARLDGMVTLRGCRSVDAAAGQLIVREAGGLVAFPRCPTPLGAPLDLVPHSPLIAERTAQGLEELSAVPLL